MTTRSALRHSPVIGLQPNSARSMYCEQDLSQDTEMDKINLAGLLEQDLQFRAVIGLMQCSHLSISYNLSTVNLRLPSRSMIYVNLAKASVKLSVLLILASYLTLLPATFRCKKYISLRSFLVNGEFLGM